MSKIGASLADELRYAGQDIRQTWESLWFGQAVTPANQLHHREVARDDFERMFAQQPTGQDISITMQQDMHVSLHRDIDR